MSEKCESSNNASPQKNTDWEKLYVFYGATFGGVVQQQDAANHQEDAQSSNSHESLQASQQEEEDEKTILKKYSIKKVKGIQKEKKGTDSSKSTPSKKRPAIAPKRKQKHKGDKCEVAVVYKKPSGALGVRKIVFAMDAKAKKLAQEDKNEFRKVYGKLLLGQESFSKEVFETCGGFLNPKFWQLNTIYNSAGGTEDFKDVVVQLTELVKAQLH